MKVTHNRNIFYETCSNYFNCKRVYFFYLIRFKSIWDYTPPSPDSVTWALFVCCVSVFPQVLGQVWPNLSFLHIRFWIISFFQGCMGEGLKMADFGNFFFWWGGKWGTEPPMGGNAPMPPWCCHCFAQGSMESCHYESCSALPPPLNILKSLACRLATLLDFLVL